LDRNNIWGKTKYWKTENIIFGLYVLEEEGVEGNENFCNQLQEILNSTNKNDYILLLRDMKARTGNAEIHNIVEILENLLQIPCSRRKFWKIRNIYTNKRLKMWEDEIKLKVQQTI